MTKPSFISEADWKCLCEKYKSQRVLEKTVKRIENNYPIQYAIGNVEFYNSKIIVNKNVLIPRFETELLVEKLIKYIKNFDLEKESVLDLCTGSGCIAISLKKELKNAKIVGIDKSYSALSVALKNAKLNKVDIDFNRMDVLKNFNIKKKFSVLVSNPPYVRVDEEVSINTKYEPQMALFPGEDDIIFYKKILDNAKNILYEKNIIAFEIGSTQAERICKYASKIYKDAKIIVEQDYNGFDRFIFIFNNCE